MQSQQSTNSQQSYVAVAVITAHQSQPSHGHKRTPAGSSDVDPPSMRFKINDQVVVYDRRKTPLHGIVCWTGRKNHMGHDLDEIHIGIEMVCAN